MEKKMRAVYYCRVSTDDENQTSSIINQKAESIQTIKDNKWELVDEYIDEGKSGTTTKKRDEYNRLFRDMETDKFDVIVIKSQDRLMRNTKEWYFFIDKLVQNNKQLYFYLDRKFYSPDDALITGIKAILAEDYSRSLSKNINNAHRKRQETGSGVIITSKTWGYDNINKKITINEKEAEMIKFIYEMAAQNYGSRTISKMLQEKGYNNRNGKKIAEQTVRKIIRNPLYKGTALMNVYHKNFETKLTERNDPDKWIYHDNIVPAIVSEELWNTANKLMDKRSISYITKEFKIKTIGSKKNCNPLTSKIVCGLCGNNYWRSTNVNGKYQKVYWNCCEYIRRGRKTKNERSPKGEKAIKYETTNSGCDNIHIKETDLDKIIYDLTQRIYAKSKENISSVAISILKQIIDDSSEIENQEQNLIKELNRIKSNRDTLLDRYLEDKIAHDIYHIKDSSLQEQMNTIEEEIQNLNKKKEDVADKEKRIKDLEKEINTISDYDLSINNFKNHIEKIIVYPNYIIFQFDIFDDIKVEVNRINYKRVEYYICL